MTSKESIELEIAYHLRNNDPESAKSVYDQWVMKSNKSTSEKEEATIDTNHNDLF